MPREQYWYPRMLIDGAPPADNSSTNVSVAAPAAAPVAAPAYDSSGSLPDDYLLSIQPLVSEDGWIIVAAIVVSFNVICISTLLWIHGHKRVLQAWKGIGLTVIGKRPWRRAPAAPVTELAPLQGAPSGALSMSQPSQASLLSQALQALSSTDAGLSEAASDATSRQEPAQAAVSADDPGGKVSMVNTANEEGDLEEPLVKYSAAEWAVPSDMDLEDESLFVEPITPIIVPPKYKSSDYCTYKPPAL